MIDVGCAREVDAYLEEGALPPPGTVCRQEVPFTAPETLGALGLRGAEPEQPLIQQHVKPLPMR